MAYKRREIGQQEFENALIEDMAGFFDDPYGFVCYAFPWGQPGPLANYKGPDKWQARQLVEVGDTIKADNTKNIREAIASGHGIGKSTQVAWLILWAMSTRPHLNGVITANTNAQLSTKTWRELQLWHDRLINKDWFECLATKIFHKKHQKTWIVNAMPNNPNKPETFAGLHAEHVLIIYDEASAIDDEIWRVTEGAMTTPGAMWFAYGNPTRNTGRFRECFRNDKARWRQRQIDSRTCAMTDKKELADQIKAYGIDSDFARVRILGQFPKIGNTQFIAQHMVDLAVHNKMDPEVHRGLPVVLGVDVARFGDDANVLVARQGRKALGVHKWRETNLMETARRVAQYIDVYHPSTTFVDGVGMGAGVVDRLVDLSYQVVEVNAGSKPDEEDLYFNKRMEMWDRMKKWLEAGADIPNDTGLYTGLISIEYGYDDRDKLRLERKSDMKKRGLESPDEADALAHTFAEPVGSYGVKSFEPKSSFEGGALGLNYGM